MYHCYYLQTPRDLVPPVCRFFYLMLETIKKMRCNYHLQPLAIIKTHLGEAVKVEHMSCLASVYVFVNHL